MRRTCILHLSRMKSCGANVKPFNEEPWAKVRNSNRKIYKIQKSSKYFLALLWDMIHTIIITLQPF